MCSTAKKAKTRSYCTWWLEEHRLRILISFCTSTLADEICQLLRKSSNIQGKAHSASVFSASRLCDLCGLRVSASLWHHVHHTLRITCIPLRITCIPLRILISFCASTLADEICQLLRKSSNIQGKAHSASVFSASRLCDLRVPLASRASHASRASLRLIHCVFHSISPCFQVGFMS